MHNAGLISMRNTQYMAYYSIHEPYAWSRTNDNNTIDRRKGEVTKGITKGWDAGGGLTTAGGGVGGADAGRVVRRSAVESEHGARSGGKGHESATFR